MNKWRWALALVALAAVLRADDRAAREVAVRQTLDSFWGAVVRGDSLAFRRAVDFPLTLLQPPTDDQPGNRFIVTEAGWLDFEKGFPLTPLAPELANFELDNLRLEWLDEGTCLAVFDLAAEIRGATVGGHFTTIVCYRDGWRVAVSSIPL